MRLLQYAIKNKEIIPVVACAGFACVMGVTFLTRAAIKSPDVVIDKRNKTPWLDVKPNEQVKIYSPTADFSKLTSDRPEID